MRTGLCVVVSVLASMMVAEGAAVDTSTGPTVWFVDNTAPATGDGSSGRPLASLAEAERRSAAGDWIFIRSGDGSSRGLDTGIRLKPGQSLLGEGLGLDAGGDTVVPGRPPTISNPSGHGVILASGCEVGGLNVGPVHRSGFFGVGVRDVRLHDLRVIETGGAGVELENPAGVVDCLGLEISGAAGDGVAVRLGGSGKLAMTIDGCRFSEVGGTAAALEIEDKAAATMVVTRSAISGAGSGLGMTVLDSAGLDFGVVDNPAWSDIEGTIVNLFVDPDSTSASRVSGVIARNPELSKRPGSGFGIRLSCNGDGRTVAAISDTRIAGGVEADYGILAETRLGAAALDLELVSNEIVVGEGALAAILVRARDDGSVCMRATDNGTAGGATGLAIQQRDRAVFALGGEGEGRIEPANVERRLASANPGMNGVAVSAVGTFTGAPAGCVVAKEIVR